MKITADLLRKYEACKEDVEIFEKEWPEGAKVTLENCKRAANLDLDLDWAAQNLLTTAAALEAYEKATAAAWKAYDKAIAAAWEAYGKATAAALEAYEKATAPAWEAYEKATAPAWEASEKTRAAALEVYKKATVPAFFEAWQLENRPDDEHQGGTTNNSGVTLNQEKDKERDSDVK